ncbi:MAG TPA: right-handed parallel beta-helix repeat-containing protein [Actinomycetota bacterium]|nr:right-handed parallel beta-helix repeat-containing protein [Actinomycetota bacterium]
MSPRRLAVATALAATIGAGVLASSRPAVIEVPAGRPVEAAVRGAPEGAVVRLGPGLHGGFTVRRALSVVAEPGAAVRGPVVVRADGVRLEGLTIVGGRSGVVVREADDARLVGVTVRGAELHGIEVVDGSARIEGCRIEGLASPYAQGVEVRNAAGRPRTVVRGCVVAGGQEGLVSHVSRVEFLGNRVSGTALRAIAVTEMSEGLVSGNVVEGAVGVGIYCGDMSHCEIRENDVRWVAADPSGVRSRAGYPVVVYYQATARVSRNELRGEAGRPVGLFLGSALADRFPLGVWPAGWRGLLPGLPLATAAAGGALVAARAAVGPWIGRRRARLRREVARQVPVGPLFAPAVAAGLAVQGFHMLEHAVQVFQVYVADAEVRSGILGRRFDAEWVHFAYNLAALAFLLWVARAVWRGELGWQAAAGAPAAFLAAAALTQTYHFAEHVAKVVQHELRGIDPAPGLLGGAVGLVWFHFGINLAVYAGFVLGALPLLRHPSAGGAPASVPDGAWTTSEPAGP